ncbi:hypothetical protein ACIRRH_34770 [Kitasatospora sp. NPDC101235]|uniref:hypothetical protein n=1 Tax=Kitasatospora sp. NPDC101235 TaxID=3364101 RepID=UPI003816E9CC
MLPRQQDDDPLRPPSEPYLRGLGRYDLIRNAGELLGPGCAGGAQDTMLIRYCMIR